MDILVDLLLTKTMEESRREVTIDQYWQRIVNQYARKSRFFLNLIYIKLGHWHSYQLFIIFCFYFSWATFSCSSSSFFYFSSLANTVTVLKLNVVIYVCHRVLRWMGEHPRSGGPPGCPVCRRRHSCHRSRPGATPWDLRLRFWTVHSRRPSPSSRHFDGRVLERPSLKARPYFYPLNWTQPIPRTPPIHLTTKKEEKNKENSNKKNNNYHHPSFSWLL